MDTALNYGREVWDFYRSRHPKRAVLQDRCSKAVVCSTQLVGDATEKCQQNMPCLEPLGVDVGVPAKIARSSIL